MPPPARMGYRTDLTQLPGYEADQDFLFSDIQLGKGKAKNTRNHNGHRRKRGESVIQDYAMWRGKTMPTVW